MPLTNQASHAPARSHSHKYLTRRQKPVSKPASKPRGFGRPSGFTLIELLVVIAIIAILAAILFPVFAQAREKGRQAVCMSNLKQFMLGIMQYSQDYDESMPLCVKTADGAGPGMVGVGGITREFGVPEFLDPYVKSEQLYHCPDDPGFVNYTTAKAAGVAVPGGMDAWRAFGTSYKFNFDSFSIAPQAVQYAYPTKYQSVKDKGSAGKYDKALYSPGSGVAGSGTQDPPYPMTMAYFARPAQTMVMHCYTNNWSVPDPTKADCVGIMHQNATLYAFADGHVKALLSKGQSESFCDGPTYSPIRNPGQPGYNAAGDGSCNTSGMERNKN